MPNCSCGHRQAGSRSPKICRPSRARRSALAGSEKRPWQDIERVTQDAAAMGDADAIAPRAMGRAAAEEASDKDDETAKGENNSKNTD